MPNWARSKRSASSPSLQQRKGNPSGECSFFLFVPSFRAREGAGRRQDRKQERSASEPGAMDPSSPLNDPRLMALIEKEQNKAMANEFIAKLTDICWDKCITGSIGSSFSSSETSCLSNCAKRFLDVKMSVMQRVQRQ